MATPVDANYIRARAGLLDALAALGPLRQAAVLVGAQAIYEHTRGIDAHFGVSPFTLDADVALDPELLVDDPRITEAMQAARYSLADQPGMYRRDDDAQVDILVPEAVGGRRGRGAKLGVHGTRAARQVRGLEGALVRPTLMTIRALAPGDDRAYEIKVAGPAALLVAKIHKLADRADAPGLSTSTGSSGQSTRRDWRLNSGACWNMRCPVRSRPRRCRGSPSSSGQPRPPALRWRFNMSRAWRTPTSSQPQPSAWGRN